MDHSGLSSSVKKKYLFTIILLLILSILNISIKSDKVNSNLWSFAIELQVTSATLVLVFLLWLPILLPWLLNLFPQLQGSLNWLREQGIEEVETNLLRIKLRYGIQAASQNYEEEIQDFGSTAAPAQSTQQQIEKRYRDAIALTNVVGEIDASEALKRIDQLADYYDQVREEMPSGSNRSRLMREIASTMWVLIPQTLNFPVTARLNSDRGGERLSAYKYLEWQPSTEHVDVLLSRAVGIMEVPFGQYAALLTLRRVVTSTPLDVTKVREIIHLLNWSARLDYMRKDRSRLMAEIVSLLEVNQ